ncbi:MAG: hypothetical protein HY235_03725 [Acidobacteria bacterium]|nr:hypothetical protein [Acidobacteriota bacterium]
MATLATLYDRWIEVEDHLKGKPAGNRLRPFPNEDVYFFVKAIDNTRVIRQADPGEPRVCWRLIGGAIALAVLLIGLLLPSGYRLMAGYQLEDLRRQHESLQKQLAALELDEAKLLSPERLAELARFQEFVDPEPGRVVHLQDRTPALALRREAGVADENQR